jgi:RNA methyltransferase, TrmH family
MTGDAQSRPPSEAVGIKHPLVGQLRRLARRRRERVERAQFLVEGTTLVEVALDAGADVELVVRDTAAPVDDRVAAVLDRAATAGIRVVDLAPGAMERISDAVTPQPLAAVVHRATASLADGLEAALDQQRPVVVLAEVADPGNAGTLLRSAEAAGCAAVISCGGVDPFSPKTVRSSAGAVFLVPIVETESLRLTLAALGDAGVRRVGLAAHGGQDLAQSDLGGAVAIVLGSESHGLPDGLDRALDQVVTIATEGRGESLNVAMAGTLAVFEAARQRRSNASPVERNRLDATEPDGKAPRR